MKVLIEGSAKEIAALVKELQEQREKLSEYEARVLAELVNQIQTRPNRTFQ